MAKTPRENVLIGKFGTELLLAVMRLIYDRTSKYHRSSR